MNHVHNKQQGFTLIELTLAMAFISFLLLAIALTIIQISAIYNQGTTSREINQASRDINADLSRNISAAGALTLADDYVLRPLTGDPVGGRLCLGSYSYIWNYTKAIQSDNTDVTKYVSGPAGDTGIRLLKVPDPGRIYCAKDGSGGLANKNVSEADRLRAQELLKPGDHELGLHNFAFISPVPASAIDTATEQQVYSLTYTIGTTKLGALNPTQTACLAPGILNADPLYCKIQQFSLVLRAGNGVN
jgi:type II secretory pathway pseudopilin PulG